MAGGLGGLNGKTGEVLRWVLGISLGCVVAYYTAQIEIERRLTMTDGAVSAIRTLEEAHFQEVQRSLTRIERAIERIEATGMDRKTGEPYAVQRNYQR